MFFGNHVALSVRAEYESGVLFGLYKIAQSLSGLSPMTGRIFNCLCDGPGGQDGVNHLGVGIELSTDYGV
jgi:hypothetical protein